MKVVLINDTRFEMHHGCSRVMNVIDALLDGLAVEVTGRVPVSTDWSVNEEIKRKIIEADALLINGEGSLHDGGLQAFRIISSIAFAKAYGKKAFLINSIYHDNPAEFDEIVSQCDWVLVRDSESYSNVRKFMDRVTLAPDFSLYDFGGEYSRFSGAHQANVAFTCSVSMEKTIRVRQLAKSLFPDEARVYAPIIYQKNIWGDRDSSAKSLFQRVKGYISRYGSFAAFRKITFFLINFRALRELSVWSKQKNHIDYCRFIASTSFLLTGRFHAACLAIFSRTPFVAVASNTRKIEMLIKDIGLNPKRVVSESSLVELSPELLSYSDEEVAKIGDYIREGTRLIDRFFETHFGGGKE